MNGRPGMRNGVSASRVQVPEGQWSGVLEFLCVHFPAVEKTTWQARLQDRLVLDAAGQPVAASDACVTGMTLFYYRSLPQETPIPFQASVLYRDAAILVVDKPHFLPVLPSGRYVQETLLVRLKQQLGLEALSPIHRIDKDTAGLVLFSVDPASRDAYQSLFRQRVVSKVYEAWAPVMPERVFPLTCACRLAAADEFFRTAVIAGEPNSETRVDVLERRGAWARYQLQPVTGRKHQLRVHMAHLGAPILHDRWYPHVRSGDGDPFGSPLQLLAKSLAFVDPLSGEARYFESRQRLLAEPECADSQSICN